MSYCCESLQRRIERKQMVYDPIRGCFMFYINDEEWGGAGVFNKMSCDFCPFCGAKLPKDQLAGEIYYDELEKAVGKEYCDIKEEDIPEEFKTDEWWKKRGL